MAIVMTLFTQSFHHKASIWTLLLVIGFSIDRTSLAGVLINPQADANAIPELYYWQAILPYGSEQQSNRVDQAFSELNQALFTIDAMREATERKMANQDAWLTLNKAIGDLAFDTLMATNLHPYLYKPTADERMIQFNGRWAGNDEYQFVFGKLENTSGGPRMGNLSAELILKKGSYSESSAIVESNAGIDFGTLLFIEMLQSMEAFFWQLDAERITTGIGPDVLSRNINTGGGLDAHDLSMLSQLTASIPHVIESLSRYSVFEKLVEIRAATDSPERISHIKLRQRLDLDAMKQYVPETLENYGWFFRHVSFAMTVKTDTGGSLAKFQYDAVNHLASIDLLLHKGGVVVANSAGQASMQVIHPTRLHNFDFQVSTDIDIDLWGLKIHVDELVLDSNYLAADWQQPSRDSSLGMNLNRLPKVQVEGAFLHIIPAAVIDVLIPGTIETAITDTFREAVYGNDGRGALLGFEFKERDGHHRLQTYLNFEIPYQLIQDTAIELYQSTDQQKPAGGGLLNSLRLALRQDFTRISRLYEHREIVRHLAMDRD